MPFDVMVHYSDVIVHATIDSAQPHVIDGVECGIRYTATILTTFRQSPVENLGRQITFGRWPGLEIGRSYVLFLNRVSDVDFYQSWLSNIAEPQDRLMMMARCNGIAPGLQADRSMWKVVDDKIEIDGVLPHPWPHAIPMHRKIDPPIAVASREYLFAYLKNWTPARLDSGDR